jgi:hypothetical protein
VVTTVTPVGNWAQARRNSSGEIAALDMGITLILSWGFEQVTDTGRRL